MKDLGTLAGSWSAAEAVNSKGVIVGSSLDSAGDQHAFVYAHGRMTDLKTLGGQSSVAHDINDRGVIIGSSNVADGDLHAFIDKNGTMTDLNSLIPASSGWTLYRGLGINNKGQLEVEAYPTGDQNGPHFGLLLTPTKR